ncbi:hypothetical protein [Paracoccus sp. ME4]|uniref:hypothetical protein n=1 Tax=Paracoccus sp. ME4 TaxID=3138066 RepID=UPI00398A7827
MSVQIRNPISAAMLSLALLAAPAAWSQTARVAETPDCPAPESLAEPATQPDATDDATAAENAGTTGWSGGTGGSQLGTNAQGAVDSSPNWQPPTARGLDLQGDAEIAAVC